MRIALVASRNGHGHARRLLHLGFGLEHFGAKVTIFCSDTSLPLLKLESASFERSSVSLELATESFETGFDGPYSNRSQSTVAKKSKSEMHRKFANFEFVIGDNVLWPAEYSSTFIFHGHFLWIDYYRETKSRRIDCLQEKQEADLRNLSLTKKFLMNEIFEIPSQYLRGNNVIKMPLMQYVASRKQRYGFHEPRDSTVWLSQGLTESTSEEKIKRIIRIVDSLGLKIQQKETFNLGNFPIPNVVIGRPGLGTIRDIMNYGVDFVPIEFRNDFELKHNVEVLVKQDLIQSDGTLDETILKVVENSRSLKLKAFWQANSLPCIDYSALCMKEFSSC